MCAHLNDRFAGDHQFGIVLSIREKSWPVINIKIRNATKRIKFNLESL